MHSVPLYMFWADTCSPFGVLLHRNTPLWRSDSRVPLCEWRVKSCGECARMNSKWADIHIAEMHSRHICWTDVCKHPVLLIPLHMGVTELAGAYPTPENKAELEGVGCCWSVVVVEVAGKVEPQLKRGHFSAVIALCCIGPGVSVTAAEAWRCYDAPSQKSLAKMPNTADENLT